jgi:predicted DNA-binding transcriptional regulator AlpA
MTTAPRLLSREQAAAYVGLSPAQFDQEVKAGTFPERFPLASTRRALWDRAALDRAMDARMTGSVEQEGFDARRDRWRARQDRQANAR